jgi:hypothetical protein
MYLVALLAIVASVTGLKNGFALDDVQLIAANDRLHHLSGALDVFTQPYWPPEEGSSLYRPLTSLAFVFQWVIGGGSPFPFHIVSIVLYAVACVAAYRLALLLVDERSALIAGALFAVHPLHTEAVANVVGQAELWSALFAIGALLIYIRARNAGGVSRRKIVEISACYGAALLFKEHVIVLPAIVAAYELTGNRRLRDAVPTLIALTCVGAVFVALRASVIGEIQGAGVSPIFAGEGFSARLFTMLRVSTEWTRLFFWPAHLSADYTPSQVPIATAFAADMISGILVIAAAGIFALRERRNQAAIAFCIVAAGILLLIPSNLIVVTGFVLAERTLFLPSVMVVIAGVAVLRHVFENVDVVARNRAIAARLSTASICVIIGLGVIRSAERNPVWRDNESLIVSTVIDAPESARAHMMMAQLLSDNGLQRKALDETERALELGSPRDSQLFAFAADMYQLAGDCKTASKLYARSLGLRADQPQVRINAAVCAARLASAG